MELGSSKEPDGDSSQDDPVDLAATIQAAAQVAGEGALGSGTRSRRVDVYLFFSFDLVGSTRMKSKKFVDFHWVELIQYFYGQCKRLVGSLGIENAVVWKYVGDEVLFYQKITKPAQIEHSVSSIYRVLDTFIRELAENAKFSEAASTVSIKAIAWVASVISFADVVPEKMIRLVDKLDEQGLLTDDRLYQEQGNDILDFLGPNIDAGFRLEFFARRLQLVVSPGLAYFLRSSDVAANNLRIIGFSELRGVADRALYPGIWYCENWSKLRACFSYEERHADDLVHSVCKAEYEPL